MKNSSRYPVSMTRLNAGSLKSTAKISGSVYDPTRHRLEIAFFDIPADTLPNGLPRQSPVACVCAFRLAGEFHGWARVERGENGPLLAVEDDALDMIRGRFVRMEYGLGVLHGLYREMGRCFIAAQGRAAHHGAGRN